MYHIHIPNPNPKIEKTEKYREKNACTINSHPNDATVPIH